VGRDSLAQAFYRGGQFCCGAIGGRGIPGRQECGDRRRKVLCGASL